MNNRATLIDTWRLIEFNANALETGLDLVFSGEVGTTGDNPLSFNHTTGGLRAGLRFDAPFTRLLERNNYRQQLILYQQVRRGLIQFEDATHRTLRQHLRLLNQRRTNLEIQRRAVVIAIRRVDQTRENFNKPVASSAPGPAAQQFGPTAAFDLLTALSDLRSAQNNFMGVWLQYYSSHMQLIRELGVMQLDENGMWIQESLDNVERMWPEDCVLPPEIPAQWFKDLDANGAAPPANETGLNDADSSGQPVPPEPQTTPEPPIQPPEEPVLPNLQNRNEASRKRRGTVPRLLDARAVSIAKPLRSTETMAASKRPVIVPLEQATDADRSNTPAIMPVSQEELQTR